MNIYTTLLKKEYAYSTLKNKSFICLLIFLNLLIMFVPVVLYIPLVIAVQACLLFSLKKEYASNTNALNFRLPVKKSQIIKSKYLFAFIIMMSGTLLSIFDYMVSIILNKFNLIYFINSLDYQLSSIVLLTVLNIITFSIFMPLDIYFKKIVYQVGYVISIALSTTFYSRFNSVVPNIVLIILLIIAIILFVISLIISIGIYERKQLLN